MWMCLVYIKKKNEHIDQKDIKGLSEKKHEVSNSQPRHIINKTEKEKKKKKKKKRKTNTPSQKWIPVLSIASVVVKKYSSLPCHQ